MRPIPFLLGANLPDTWPRRSPGCVGDLKDALIKVAAHVSTVGNALPPGQSRQSWPLAPASQTGQRLGAALVRLPFQGVEVALRHVRLFGA